ncbi:5-formyltetrahydrofolate cyclo-ligase [Agarivorans sp. TSD2052]|uniref:5-formyltetrahydrofolate cyclo-ligase n=1 Tax=Agarivorans sp. TSD2052 TaxID=2937286 RepID=UPI00200BB424|nr:5-formyltetrahydrofolate cyclo-ligase [Agarivorans sp. TSD2052]UPW19440.1 5-formyltetrahydrofolate cyclo-ligase [Agarivorans sp. TSD2052]
MSQLDSHHDQQHRQQLRQSIRQQRRALSPEQQQQAGLAILERLQQDPTLASMQRCALYLAFDGEVDLSVIIGWLWQQNKQVFVPLVDPSTSGAMCFHHYHANSPMQLNQFGIAEPVFDHAEVQNCQQLDVILAPLVAFDSEGNRLGMGGGYYDRLLAQCDGEKPAVVGVAHDCQQVDQVPMQDWDQPLKRIITPSKDWQW